MRVALRFNIPDTMELPKSYQHLVQAFIYSLLTDEQLAGFLHDEGFGDKRKFKLFTFSLLRGPYAYNQDTHTVTYKSHFYLEIASLFEPFIQNITQTLLSKEHFELHGYSIALTEYKYITRKLTSHSVDIDMISPVCVYRTVTENGSRRTQYFSPNNREFKEYIKQNFIRKYQAAYKTAEQPNIDIHPVEVKPTDKLILRYKGQVIIAYKGRYRLEGYPKHLDFLYRTGLGSKNSMGFGMFMVVA